MTALGKDSESEVTGCDLLKMSFLRVTELPEIKWQRFQTGALLRREKATKEASPLLADEMLPLFSAPLGAVVGLHVDAPVAETTAA